MQRSGRSPARAVGHQLALEVRECGSATGVHVRDLPITPDKLLG